MNVTSINQITQINTLKSNAQKVSFAQKPDTFEKTSDKFDIKAVDAQLRSIKNIKGENKFNDEKIELIKGAVQKEPEKWKPFSELIQNPKIISSIALEFLQKNANDLKILNEISKIKNPDDSIKFSALDLRNISKNLEGSQLNKFKILSSSALNIDNLTELAKDENFKNPEKAVKKINEMAETCKNNGFLDLQLKKDEYEQNSYALTATTLNGKNIELLDKDLNRISIEQDSNVTRQNGRKYTIKKAVDFRNNTTTKVVLENIKRLPQPVLVNEVRIIKDKNGNKIRTEYASQSDVPGVLNIKHVMPDGTEKIISEANVNEKTGITSIKKNMTSLDGTKTEYLYEDDKQGNRISDYKIIDKNGKVLLNNSVSFEVVNDKKFISSKNSEKYEITVNEKSINVKDLNKGKTSTINFENYINGNKEKILSVMKQMPGEELIALSEKTKQLEGIDDIMYSTYGAVNKRIKTGDNLFVMLHELGHAKDYGEVDVKQKETLTKSIFNNKKINEIFEKEKAEFNKAFPDAQRNHINYFIKTSEYKDGIQEAIAESNAILNTRNQEDLFAIRSHYLQQYFPRTIAELAKVLNK